MYIATGTARTPQLELGNQYTGTVRHSFQAIYTRRTQKHLSSPKDPLI